MKDSEELRRRASDVNPNRWSHPLIVISIVLLFLWLNALFTHNVLLALISVVCSVVLLVWHSELCKSFDRRKEREK